MEDKVLVINIFGNVLLVNYLIIKKVRQVKDYVTIFRIDVISNKLYKNLITNSDKI